MDNVDKSEKINNYRCSPVGKIVNKLLIIKKIKISPFIFPQVELKYLYTNGSKWGDGIEF